MYAYTNNNHAMFLCVMIHVRDKELLNLFGLHLRLLRESKKMSQELLANKADVSLSQISRMERGVINPTLCTLVAISDALNVSLQDLLTFKN